MGHHKSNVRDLESNLLEVLGLSEMLQTGDYGDLDAYTDQAIIAEVHRIADGPRRTRTLTSQHDAYSCR